MGSTISYSLGTGQYTTLLSPTDTQVYLGPYPTISAITELTTATYNAQFSAANLTYFTPASTTLDAAVSTVSSSNTLNTETTSIINTITTNLTAIESTLAQVTLLDYTYSLIGNNGAYSSALQQVMDIEYSNFNTNTGITSDGYFPLPSKLAGLVCWLSANNVNNGLFPDTIGNVRVITLVDMAANRSFTSLPNTAPILRPSTDKTGSTSGITNGNVLSFTNGTSLTLSEGSPIYITPGMTIIALIKTGPVGTSLQLLGNPTSTTTLGLFANTTDNRSLTIETSAGWVPIATPPSSQPSNTSTILVGSISALEEAQCWFASGNEFNAVLYPRGVMHNTSTWPSSSYQGDPLTQIGNANFGIPNIGEFAELLIYDRQLSAAEVKAVVAYLQLRYSLATALAVDFAALSAF